MYFDELPLWSQTGGDVVILGLNLSPSQTVNLALPGAGSRRSWYVRSALAGNASAAAALRSSSVALMAAGGSWEMLQLEGTMADPKLPALDGVAEAAGVAMVLEPQSYAFTVLSGLAPGACGGG